MVINHLERLFVTNDASTIVNELEVFHPAAKLLVMAAKAQAGEVGDGTNLVSGAPGSTQSIICTQWSGMGALGWMEWVHRGWTRLAVNCVFFARPSRLDPSGSGWGLGVQVASGCCGCRHSRCSRAWRWRQRLYAWRTVRVQRRQAGSQAAHQQLSPAPHCQPVWLAALLGALQSFMA